MKSKLYAGAFTMIFALCLAGAASASWVPFAGSPPGTIEPVVEIISSTDAGLELEIILPGIDLVKKATGSSGIPGDLLVLPGTGTTNTPGAPLLPAIRNYIGLSRGFRPGVEVLESEYIVFENLDIGPAPQPVFEGEEPVFLRDPSIYQDDSWYPATLAEVGEPGILRDLVLSSLEITPVLYNPELKIARVYTRIKLRLTEGPSGGEAPVTAIRHFITPDLDNFYRSRVLNYDYMSIPGESFDSEDIKYLVISLPEYFDEIEPLVTWRRKMGYQLEVVDVADLGGTSTGIKNYISDLYFSDGLEYVLLIGDIDEVPAHHWTDTYSDSWYSCVAPGGNSDYLADLAIGRLTFANTAELTHQLDKILNYMKSPSTSDNWAEKNILIAHSESYPGKYTGCCEEIRTYPYSIQVPIFDTAYGGAGAGNSDVVAAVNDGRGIVNYRGHGSSTSWSSWGSEGSLTATHVNQMYNAEMSFVCFSICCNNMELSYGSNCLAETFMKADYAAIAFLGAWEPSYTDANHTFDKGLFKAIYDEGINTIGYIENWANVDVHYGHGSYGDTNIRMYLWLGDPATDVWTLQPAQFSVAHPSAVVVGAQDVEVQVGLGGGPMEGARVCFAKTGEFLTYGFTDASGYVTLSIEPLSPGTMFLTVTGHNGLPYEVIIDVITPEGPWLVLDDKELDDTAGGNGNGMADYGETIVIATAAKNVGADAAYDVNALLTTADPEVAVNSGVDTYGTILADEIVWGAGGFVITVDDYCTDEHSATFDIEFSDSVDSTWTGSFSIVLHAPVLSAGSPRIDDLAFGNGDLKLDPGETADLYVMAVNSGSGVAEDLGGRISTTDPYLTILVTDAAYPDIDGGGEAENYSAFMVEADAGTPDGYIATVDILFATDKGYTVSDQFRIHIGGFSDDMEDGEGDWEHYVVTSGYVDQWHLSTQRSHSPTHSWKCGDTGSGNYDDYMDAGLVTPPIALGTNSQLVFRHWMDAELDAGVYAWDGGIVEISTNSGVSWVQIEPVGGYPYLITDNPASPFAPDTPCYSGNVNWDEETFDVSAYSGEVYFRFRFGTDGYVTEEGWYIDDVQIVSGSSGVTLEIVESPSVIHPGDTASWIIGVTNSGETRTVDFWITAELQDGDGTDFLIASDVLLPAGYSGESTVSMNVPAGAPSGTFAVVNKLGDYPGNVLASDTFIVDVTVLDTPPAVK